MLDLGDVSAYGIVVLTATLTWIARLVVFGDPGPAPLVRPAVQLPSARSPAAVTNPSSGPPRRHRMAAFVFVTTEDGGGWVPERCLDVSCNPAVVIIGYDTTELATTAGEELNPVARDDPSGWAWPAPGVSPRVHLFSGGLGVAPAPMCPRCGGRPSLT
jgi:hypothetical protein